MAIKINMIPEGERMLKNALINFRNKVADVIMDEAKDKVPVRTGTLQRSIHVENDERASHIIADADYACVLNGDSNVITKTGNKRISNIVIGDEVLCQTGDYVKITNTNRINAEDKPKMVSIETEYRKDRTHKITLTEDHKVIVYRDGRNKWVEAKYILPTDELFTMIKKDKKNGIINIDSWKEYTCKNCNKIFSNRIIYDSKFCCEDCKFEYWNKKGNNPHIGAKRTQETKDLIAKITKQRLKDKPWTHPNYICGKKGHMTKPEIWVKDWLEVRGKKYEFNKLIGNKYVDFYLPDTHEVYEADGCYWHKDQQKDINRDKALLTIDPTLKITHIHFYDKRWSNITDPNPFPNVFYVVCNPNTNSYVNPEVFKKVKIIKINKWDYKRNIGHASKKLYDLTCENIHSFYCNGVLISNCFVELGTRHQAANPYLVPALQTVARKFNNEFNK